MPKPITTYRLQLPNSEFDLLVRDKHRIKIDKLDRRDAITIIRRSDKFALFVSPQDQIAAAFRSCGFVEIPYGAKLEDLQSFCSDLTAAKQLLPSELPESPHSRASTILAGVSALESAWQLAQKNKWSLSDDLSDFHKTALTWSHSILLGSAHALVDAEQPNEALLVFDHAFGIFYLEDKLNLEPTRSEKMLVRDAHSFSLQFTMDDLRAAAKTGDISGKDLSEKFQDLLDQTTSDFGEIWAPQQADALFSKMASDAYKARPDKIVQAALTQEPSEIEKQLADLRNFGEWSGLTKPQTQREIAALKIEIGQKAYTARQELLAKLSPDQQQKEIAAIQTYAAWAGVTINTDQLASLIPAPTVGANSQNVHVDEQ